MKALRKCSVNDSNYDHCVFFLYFPNILQSESIHLWLEKSNMERKNKQNWYTAWVFLFTCIRNLKYVDCLQICPLLFKGIVKNFLSLESPCFILWKVPKCSCLQNLETINLFSYQRCYSIKIICWVFSTHTQFVENPFVNMYEI